MTPEQRARALRIQADVIAECTCNAKHYLALARMTPDPDEAQMFRRAADKSIADAKEEAAQDLEWFIK